MWRLLSGILLGWGVGANHTANVFGTGVATGVIKYRTAILLTAGFVLAGCILEGPKCMGTLRELSSLSRDYAFCCALAAGLTIALLTYLALPASASQAIVGAIVGIGLMSGSADFSALYRILACWIFTPIEAVVLGYLLHRVLGVVLDRTVRSIPHRNMVYVLGIAITGCYGAYSLGANNAANVTGVYVGAGLLTPETAALISGLSIASGVLTYSRKVIMTVGKGIVPLDPFSALVAVLAEALTLHTFTQIGVPVSSSQAAVGGIIGVGIVRDAQTVSTRTLTRIAAGWVMTPLSSGLIACLFAGLIP